MLSLFELVKDDSVKMKFTHQSYVLFKSPKESYSIYRYTKAHLLNLRSREHTTSIDKDTCNHIKGLNIKRNLRRKRGGTEYAKEYTRNHHNLLRPPERSDKTFWNPIKLNMALVNIQSFKPKLDMLMHHRQLNEIDMGFVTETWTTYRNEPNYHYVKANLDIAGYNILIQSRENWRGGGIAVYTNHICR